MIEQCLVLDEYKHRHSWFGETFVVVWVSLNGIILVLGQCLEKYLAKGVVLLGLNGMSP